MAGKNEKPRRRRRRDRTTNTASHLTSRPVRLRGLPATTRSRRIVVVGRPNEIARLPFSRVRTKRRNESFEMLPRLVVLGRKHVVVVKNENTSCL